MNLAEANIVVRRVAAALLLSTAPFVAVENANATCDPPAPVNNTTVTCTNTTTDQDGFAGYGTGSETGVTINVDPGATVTVTTNLASTVGILINDGTINNLGTVTAGPTHGSGVKAFGDITLNNSGKINDSAGNQGDRGVLASAGTATVTNNASGVIFGSIGGVTAQNVIVHNAGTIAQTNPAVSTDASAIFAGTSANIDNTGLIQATGSGTAAILTGSYTTPAGTVTVNNHGPAATIQGDAFGILTGTADVTNSGGVIKALVGNGTAIKAAGDATVHNNVDNGGGSVGLISGGAFGIDATNATVANGDASTAGGKIVSSGSGLSTAIHATGTATISNFGDGNTTGIISGDALGINAGTVNVTANTGLIEATGAATSFAIVGSTVTVDNAGTVRANGDNSAAITSGGGATINSNTGTIQANGAVSRAIEGVTVSVKANTGTIEANNGTAISAIGDATVTNIANGTSIGKISGLLFAINADGGLLSPPANVTVANGDPNTPGGVISSGVGGTAIHATGIATVSNFGNGTTTGVISGDKFGVNAATVNVTGNSGLIEARGAGGVAINAAADATVSGNTGIIRAGGLSVSVAIEATNVTVSGNSGKIEATGAGNTAIFAGGVPGGGGIAIVDNLTGVISGGRFGIHGTNLVNVTGNGGTIEALGAVSGTVATVAAIDTLGDAIVNNSNTIQAKGPGGIAINAGGTATVTNTASGTITGNANAISASTVNVLANSGTIEATASGGRAISGTSITVTNNIGGTIQANGNNGLAIASLLGSVDVTNAGTIQGGLEGIAASITKVTNSAGGTIAGGNTGIEGIQSLDVTNAVGGTISGGTNGILGEGTVRTAGTITGGTNSVKFTGGAGATNTLTLQTGAVLNGDAAGSDKGATNNLVFEGSGATTSNFQNFNNLNVRASGIWTWNSTASGTFGQTTVETGTLAVDGLLFSPVNVNANAVLGGHGTITGAISAAGIIAPGAAVPFSTLTVQGNVDFTQGSIYRVNVGAQGKTDKLQLAGGGAANLSGGKVNALAQTGFAVATPYTILTATGGLGGTQFAGVTATPIFLKPTLTYDPNNVFLTLDLLDNGGGGGGTTGFAFATVAQTRNQNAVATALGGAALSNPLVIAMLNQTSAAGARQGFDALSGEVFGSLHNAQANETQFARDAMLGRLRQASYSGYAGELGALAFGGPELAYAGDDANAAYAADISPAALPGKAPAPSASHMGERSRDLTFWAQGLGGWGHADSDGNAASLRSRFAGFLSGVDARFGDMVRAGFTAGYVRSDLNADARSSSAGIDSVQIGAYAGGKLGAFNVRGGASYSFDSIDTSRNIFFPGFTDQTKASFHGNVGQVFGEVGYGMTLDRVALEPLAGLAYVHVHDNSFGESGGAAALAGSSAHENIGYSTLGIRAATVVPLANGTALVPRASLQWQYAFGDVTPTAGLAFQGTGTGFTVAGIPIARNTALVETGFDWRFTPWAKLGAFYQGELAAHAQTHAIKGGLTWNF